MSSERDEGQEIIRDNITRFFNTAHHSAFQQSYQGEKKTKNKKRKGKRKEKKKRKEQKTKSKEKRRKEKRKENKKKQNISRCILTLVMTAGWGKLRIMSFSTTSMIKINKN